MNEPKWLDSELAVAVHKVLLAEHGGSDGIRDRKLLESALSRPKQKHAYGASSTLFDLAATLSFRLAKNHSFVDGNKRIALTLAFVFLEINGEVVGAPEAEAAATFEALAADELTEEELSQWFELHCQGA